MQITHSKPFADEEDINAVSEVIKSQKHATGDTVAKFENAMAELIGQKYAKATSSGTTALHISLLALGVSKDDEVIIPSYVCGDVLNAVNHARATPVLADIDKGFNISAKTISQLITKKTKAIILPHLFGIPADIEDILKLADTKNIAVIEDCAQSLGAKFPDGKFTGSKSIISIFSFYATKTISTGQGGMILTSSKELKKRIDDLMTYDKKPVYTTGYNYSMTDIQASLGLSQLKKLDMFISRRREIAKKYSQAFKSPSIKLTDYPKGSYPYRYVVLFSDKPSRDLFDKKLKEKNINSSEPVFYPLHRYLGLKGFENTNDVYDRILSIPIYPALSDEEVDYIVENIKV